MLDIDQIESQFRASVKERPVFDRPQVKKILIVTDLDESESGPVVDRLRKFLSILDDEEEAYWETVTGDRYGSVRELLGLCERSKADLIVTYRHLQEREDLPYSLGTYCDMLTQVMTTPILLVPKPSHAAFGALENTDRVMVMTDRIVGDRSLVNWGLRLCEMGGRLVLAHVEDDAAFHRYVQVISKIPGIDTDFAESAIEKKLLKEARDFMADVAEGVKKIRPKVEVQSEVRMGHAVKHFKSLVEEHEVDVLVVNTKDEEQLAMHGVAYSLGVELVDRPLLML